MVAKKFSLPAILDREIPDLAIPEPIQGSTFMRRTHVECIDITDVEEELTQGMIYRIEEVPDNDNVILHNDLGNNSSYVNSHFRSIEHGPFKKNDMVQILSIEDGQIISKPDDYHFNMPDYVGAKLIVTKATDVGCELQLKANVIIYLPNVCLKYVKRDVMLKRNPLKQNDKVKCMKNHNTLSLGGLYTVSHVEGDYVHLKEYVDGERFRYNLFEKWDKPSRIQVKAKKYKARMKLVDHVRYYLNRKTGPKTNLVQVRKLMLEDKIIGDDVSLKDLKTICDQMFSWK